VSFNEIMKKAREKIVGREMFLRKQGLTREKALGRKSWLK
jgi:hypothetical protein